MSDPKDWYTPTTIDGEPAYLLTREGVIFYAMKTDGDVATRAQVEIANIVAAWYRSEIFPRSAAPTVSMIFDHDAWEPQPPEPTAPTPVEIAGGVSGLQKLLVKFAEKNRGLDHTALKQLFDTHQVVMAVWQAEDEAHGRGFLTLKGTDYLIAQVKQRGTKKIRTTMTAIWCNNREHAELLQQAFTGADHGGANP
jgi:hypothetical protein